VRKYCSILLIVPALLIACGSKSTKDYAVIIKPIGPSDVTRTTFYISLKKTNFRKDNPFIDEILTDESSLRNVVSFVEDHRPGITDTINRTGWGALKISIYNANHLKMEYKLTRADYSKNYLQLLIEYLKSNASDKKLIKDLKEEGLSQIP